MSETFKLMKMAKIFSRSEFEDLKKDAAREGISFSRFTSKQVVFADTPVTVEVLHTFDGNPISSGNTNVFVVAEQPVVDWKKNYDDLKAVRAKELAEANEKLKILNRKVDQLTELMKVKEKLAEKQKRQRKGSKKAK